MGTLGSLNAMPCNGLFARVGEGFRAHARRFYHPAHGTHRNCRIQDKHTAAGYREQESEEGQAASIVAPAIGQAGLLILL